MPLSRLLVMSAASSLALFLSGCGARLAITTLKPAAYNLGHARQLTVVQTEGRRSAREYLLGQLASYARSGGHYRVIDRTEDGMTVKVAGREVMVKPGKGAALGPDEIGLRIDVLEWSSDQKTETKTNSKGGTETEFIKSGKVVLGITAFTSTGRAILAEKEYKGASSDNKFKATEEQQLALAANAALGNLLWEITPHEETDSVPLDDSEEAFKPTLKLINKGAHQLALEETRAYVAKNDTAAAHYNLAVLLDASGAYDEALSEYDLAMKRGAKKFYASSRAACAVRQQNARALAE